MMRPLDFLLEQFGVLPVIELGLLPTESVNIELISVRVTMLDIPI